MAVLSVLTYPDTRLRRVSEPVKSADPDLSQLVADLIETMEASPGCIGIAAPQVNVHKRVFVVDLTRNPKLKPVLGRMVMINPVVEWQSGKNTAREGCLSLPDLTANVERAKKIGVRATNENGIEATVEARGFEARAILHELDHLDGILFLDRVSSLKTDVFRRKRHLSSAQDQTR